MDGSNTSEKVAIIGCGKIGNSFATLFANAGYRVSVHDVNQEHVDEGITEVEKKISQLKINGLLRSTLPVEILMTNISGTTDLAQCLSNAIYVQECTVEDLKLKKALFIRLDKLATPDMILASSTSTLLPSKFSENLTHRENCLVVHPVNPPLYCPLIELVPAPWTKKSSIDKAYDLMNKIGQSPIKLNREVHGFGVNRLQYAMIAEAWRMVDSGVISATDVNKIVSQGLGLRYAFYGPLEVIHMNADGIRHHNQHYGSGMRRVLDDFGPVPSFIEPNTLNSVANQLDEKIPVHKLREHRAWRDQKLAALAFLKRDLEASKPKEL